MSYDGALQRVRQAQEKWNHALLAHEEALPDLGPFAARLRQTSEAAGEQASALEYAAEAGLKSMAKDPVVRHPPRELSSGASRPAEKQNPKLWASFDEAVKEWQDAWQSGSTLTVARAVRRLAILTDMLADEVDELRRSTGSADSGTGPAGRRAVGQ